MTPPKKNRHAVMLGRRRSPAKAASSRANGLLGGSLPKSAPTGTYRGIDVWQNAQGRWWARRTDGRFGARVTYHTQEQLLAALDAWLTPVCEVCGGTGAELKKLSNGMYTHLACLIELRRQTLEKTGLETR